MKSAATTAIVACGALAHEVRDTIDRFGLDVDYVCLPAVLHVRPAQIPAALAAKLAEVTPRYERVLVGYADCGTSGEIDAVCERFGVERLAGPHCYATFAGQRRYDEFQEEELGSFYLTDFLARNFDVMVWKSLGLDAHPELRDLYFAHYVRVVYLDQSGDPDNLGAAKDAAERLGLDFVHVVTGYGELEETLVAFGSRPGAVGSRSGAVGPRPEAGVSQ